MGFHYSTGDFGERYSQSWSGCWWLTMLPSFSAPKFCSVVWLGRLATPTTHPSRDSVPYCWHHPVGAVERSGHDLDPRTIDQTVTQRGAAIAAEIALGDRGRAECSGLALGPGEIDVLDVRESTRTARQTPSGTSGNGRC